MRLLNNSFSHSQVLTDLCKYLGCVLMQQLHLPLRFQLAHTFTFTLGTKADEGGDTLRRCQGSVSICTDKITSCFQLETNWFRLLLRCQLSFGQFDSLLWHCRLEVGTLYGGNERRSTHFTTSSALANIEQIGFKRFIATLSLFPINLSIKQRLTHCVFKTATCTKLLCLQLTNNAKRQCHAKD